MSTFSDRAPPTKVEMEYPHDLTSINPFLPFTIILSCLLFQRYAQCSRKKTIKKTPVNVESNRSLLRMNSKDTKGLTNLLNGFKNSCLDISTVHLWILFGLSLSAMLCLIEFSAELCPISGVVRQQTKQIFYYSTYALQSLKIDYVLFFNSLLMVARNSPMQPWEENCDLLMMEPSNPKQLSEQLSTELSKMGQFSVKYNRQNNVIQIFKGSAIGNLWLYSKEIIDESHPHHAATLAMRNKITNDTQSTTQSETPAASNNQLPIAVNHASTQMPVIIEDWLFPVTMADYYESFGKLPLPHKSDPILQQLYGDQYYTPKFEPNLCNKNFFLIRTTGIRAFVYALVTILGTVMIVKLGTFKNEVLCRTFIIKCRSSPLIQNICQSLGISINGPLRQQLTPLATLNIDDADKPMDLTVSSTYSMKESRQPNSDDDISDNNSPLLLSVNTSTKIASAAAVIIPNRTDNIGGRAANNAAMADASPQLSEMGSANVGGFDLSALNNTAMHLSSIGIGSHTALATANTSVRSVSKTIVKPLSPRGSKVAKISHSDKSASKSVPNLATLSRTRSSQHE